MTSGRQVDGGPFAAFVEEMPDAIVGVDQDGAIVLVNARAASLFGFERAQIIDKPLELLLPGYSRDTTRPQSAAQGGDPPTCQVATVTKLAARRKDRSLFPRRSCSRRLVDTVTPFFWRRSGTRPNGLGIRSGSMVSSRQSTMLRSVSTAAV